MNKSESQARRKSDDHLTQIYYIYNNKTLVFTFLNKFISRSWYLVAGYFME